MQRRDYRHLPCATFQTSTGTDYALHKLRAPPTELPALAPRGPLPAETCSRFWKGRCVRLWLWMKPLGSN